MSQPTKRSVLTLAVAAMLLGVGACASAPRGERVYVREAPPVERVEVIGRAPGPNYVWVAGRWNWDGRGYAWMPGRWIVAERGYRSWRPGRWAHDRRGWYWIEGHWR